MTFARVERAVLLAGADAVLLAALARDSLRARDRSLPDAVVRRARYICGELEATSEVGTSEEPCAEAVREQLDEVLWHCSTAEAAAMLGVTDRRIRQLAKAGALGESTQLRNGTWLIDRAAVALREVA